MRTRWKLERRHGEIVVHVQEMRDGRGFYATVADRRHARFMLGVLRAALEDLDRPPPPVHYFGPSPADG